MNRKRLITGMTVILLLAVYTGMYIVLPAARQTVGKNETSRAGRKKIRRHRQTVPKEPLYWTAGMADLIRVKKAATAY
ncbi:MAG: hypothetical protein ACLRWA_05525 [Lachnospira sp.]